MRVEHIPDGLRALLLATERDTIHVTFSWGKRKAFYRRFKPGDRTRALSWALWYFRDGMAWAVAVDMTLSHWKKIK